MDRRFVLFVTLFIVAALLCIGIAAAQPAGCAGRECVELPLVRAPGVAAPTPTIGATPIIGAPCDLNAPAPIEGAQAWMSRTNPPPRSYTNICFRLVVRSRFVTGIIVQVVLHRAERDQVMYSQPYDSYVSISSSDDHPGTVPVDVALPYLGQTYLAHTSFVSAPVITNTPIPSPTNTPVPTPTP